jgi:hypothetical protein
MEEDLEEDELASSLVVEVVEAQRPMTVWAFIRAGQEVAK